MKATGALAARLAQETTQLATCWRLARRDGQVYGFTDHDQDIVIDGLTYAAATGYTASTVAANAGLAVDNVDVEGLIDATVITETDLLAGRWDGAAVQIFVVDWSAPADGRLNLRSGRIGEVQLGRGQFVAELRGLTQALQQTVGELYSSSCRAVLGDARCAVVLTDYTAAGTVAAVTSARQFSTDLGAATVRLTPATTGAPPDAYFAGGLLTWTTGANAGLAMEIKGYTAASQTIELSLPMPFAVIAGDAFSAVTGCDKTFAVCKTKFGNTVNFRGEPHVPGNDRLFTPGGA